MGKLIFLCGLLFGIIACTTNQPSTNTPEPQPESQKEVIANLKNLSPQKGTEIHLMDLLTFPPYQNLKSIPPEHKFFLKKSQENFNEEGLGEDASNFSLHQELHLLALHDGMTDDSKIYRFHEGEAIEVDLYYFGIEDMEKRFQQNKLSTKTTIKEALEKGIFDVGNVFMPETEEEAPNKY